MNEDDRSARSLARMTAFADRPRLACLLLFASAAFAVACGSSTSTDHRADGTSEMAGGSGGASGTSGTGGSGAADTGGASGTGVGGTAGGKGGSGGTPDASCKKSSALPALRCRNSKDCALGSFCSPAPVSGGCGANFMAMHLCASDDECAPGSVCLTQPTPACTTGTPTACGAACTATSCGAGQRCASSGHCEPTPCDDGFDCTPGTTCDPGATGADTHGCRIASCASDGFVCPDDRECDEQAVERDAHGCAPKQCSDGSWACADGYVCGEPTALDAHGCRCASDATCGVDQICNSAGYCSARLCTTDADCDCGVCVNNGQCAADFYYCSMAAA